MSWQQPLSIMVRGLINDLSSSTQTFPDTQVIQAIVIGGLISSQEFPFKTNYTFDLVNSLISPDPTDPNTLDPIAICLFGLKASCILSVNSFQGAVGSAIKVEDSGSLIDTTQSLRGYKDLLAMGPCKAFQDIIKSQRGYNIANLGRLISNGVSHPDFLSIGYGQMWNFAYGYTLGNFM